MQENLTIFIGVTAAAVVLQMLILAGMFVVVRKLSIRMQTLTTELESRLMPLLQDGSKLVNDAQAVLEITRPKLKVILDDVAVISTTARTQTRQLDSSLKEFTDKARVQVIRIDGILTRTLDQVEETSSKVHSTVTSPFRHLNGVLQGIGVGLEAFFQKARQPHNGKPRDEMFI